MTQSQILLRNYFCPRCRVWLSATDVLCGRHVKCNERVEWREFVPEVFRQDEKDEE